MRLESLVTAPVEQWISGPCGSGKLWLLIKRVQEIAAYPKEKALVVCFSKLLAMKLNKELRFENVTVMTFVDLFMELGVVVSSSEHVDKGHVNEALKMLEEGTVQVQRYHHIFVYECEDLEDDEWPALFKKLSTNDREGLSGCKHIWFFYDPNLNLSGRSAEHVESLNRGTRLFRVCRNTVNISEQAMKYFETGVSAAPSPKPGHEVYGPTIDWDGRLKSRDDKENIGPQLVKEHIEDLNRNKVESREICILTENKDVRTNVISELNKVGIQSQNATDHLGNDETCRDKVVVETIKNFKGLSSDVVVLYNLPYSETRTWKKKTVKSLLYLGISSCVCKLVVITTECGCKALQSKEGMTSNTES